MVIANILRSAAGLAKRDPADPASPGVAAADRGSHPHVSAACNCDPRDHGRHPAVGRLEVSRRAGVSGMGGRPGVDPESCWPGLYLNSWLAENFLNSKAYYVEHDYSVRRCNF